MDGFDEFEDFFYIEAGFPEWDEGGHSYEKKRDFGQHWKRQTRKPWLILQNRKVLTESRIWILSACGVDYG